MGARAQPKWESDSSIEPRPPSFAGLYAPGEVTGKVVLGGESRAVSASRSLPSVCVRNSCHALREMVPAMGAQIVLRGCCGLRAAVTFRVRSVVRPRNRAHVCPSGL